jgi:hypothetical protein
MATNQFKIIQTVIAADVANAGVLTVGYPAGSAQADFTGVNAGALSDNVVIIGTSDRYSDPKIAVAFNAPSVAITNNSGVTWKAGSPCTIQLGQQTANQLGGPLAGIAQLAAAADLPTTVAKVNEIIAKTA